MEYTITITLDAPGYSRTAVERLFPRALKNAVDWEFIRGTAKIESIEPSTTEGT